MLILAEKPSVAKSFAEALDVAHNAEGYWSNASYCITNCIGHLFALSQPEAYDPKYAKWNLADLPIIPSSYKYERIETASKQATLVLRLFREHKDDDILIATDAGREGELIARLVMQEAGIVNIVKCKRFWVSEALTKDVIIAGIENAKPLADYNTTAAQGYARQHADWLVGMNLSRYASIGEEKTFTVGRVQTALVSAISKRNNEAAHFVPQLYKELEALIQSDQSNSGENNAQLHARLVNPATEKTAFFENDFASLALAESECKNGTIANVDVSSNKKTKKPPQLLNITGLQKIAYKRFNYAPEKTLNLAQSLYETHKCLSYPRTPSRVMGDNNVELFAEKFNLLKDTFSELSRFCDITLIDASNKHIFNSAKLEDHHALIALNALPDAASPEERNIYGIVIESFFTVCMPDFIYNEKQYVFHVGNHRFKASAKEVLQQGFTAASAAPPKPEDAENEDEEAPEISGFDEKNCSITSTQILEKKTAPKKEFAIDTLLSFMENPRGDETPAKLVGLGTPATRAEIIKKLFDAQYVVEKNKKLYATEKAQYLLESLQKDEDLSRIADVGNTTEWETQLSENPEAFEKSIADYIALCVKKEKGAGRFQSAKEEIGKCPLCANPVYEGKTNYYCSGYKNDPPCAFVIWKQSYGTAFTQPDAKLLLSGKPTKLKKCVSKAGKEFQAFFVIENGKVQIKFEDKKQ
ncbi:MAG: DNA topoisomerase 3 [Treponemataceae bacterium]|nr:MAG: DNA topoisomerase 3 [Treponemataceae bacterium]